ncbi:trigger factor [Candidatus Latescibacterota bacterium]
MTKVELKEQVGCTKKLSVEVERERYDSQLSETLKKVKKDIQVPGFRKGKAPESMIRQRFGSVIQEETLRDLIPQILNEVWESEDITPVGEPMLSDVKFDEPDPITFTVSVEETPDIDATLFKNVQATREVFELDDSDVDGALEQYRQMRAEQKEVDRESKVGDVLAVNLQMLDDSGVAIIGEKRENEAIPLDINGPLSEDTINQLVGMKKGDSKPVLFTMKAAPESPDGEQTMRYDVEVINVVEVVIPELNDEFASSLGVYENLEDMRNKVRENLESRNVSQADRKLQIDIIDEYIKQTPFEVPESMVRRVQASEVEQRKHQQPDAPFDEEAFVQEIRPDAVRAVQTFLIINAVKEQGSIEVSRDEIAERVKAIASGYNMDPKELRRELIKNGRYEEIKDSIAQSKAYEWIQDQADITEKKIPKPNEESNIIQPAGA